VYRRCVASLLPGIPQGVPRVLPTGYTSRCTFRVYNGVQQWYTSGWTSECTTGGIPRGVPQGVPRCITVVYTSEVYLRCVTVVYTSGCTSGCHTRVYTMVYLRVSYRHIPGCTLGGERDNDAQTALLSSRFTVGQCYRPCAHVLSVAGLSALITRFTVGHSSPFPFHCWATLPPPAVPVSLLVRYARPCALSFINVDIPDSCHVRKYLRTIIPEM